MSLNESGISYYKAWVKDSKIIAWTPRGTGSPYHLQKVATSPKQFGFTKSDIDKNTKKTFGDVIDPEDSKLNRFMLKNDWVKVQLDAYDSAGIVMGGLEGSNASSVHSAAALLSSKDRRFQQLTMKYAVDRIQIIAGRKTDIIMSSDDWFRYVDTGRITKSRRIREDQVKGGLADDYSDEDLAKKHGVSVEEIRAQIAKGEKVEKEHTDDEVLAKEIARDHVYEDPKYYDKLTKIEGE